MADLARDERKVPIPVLQPSTTQTVTIAGTSAASLPITNTNIIRIVSTAACHIRFGGAGGGSPATTSDMYMPPNVPEHFEIGDLEDSSLTVVNVIQNAGGGTLFITEMI